MEKRNSEGLTEVIAPESARGESLSAAIIEQKVELSRANMAPKEKARIFADNLPADPIGYIELTDYNKL